MSRPAFGHRLRHRVAELTESLADASPTPFWLDGDQGPTSARFTSGAGGESVDLVVVGGGFCGLWTALQAKERDPECSVVLLEAKRIAWAASGRNGGFFEASLTHGSENAERHFADEKAEIEELARENFAEFIETLERHGIDAGLEQTGVLRIATEPHQVEELRASGAPVLDGAELAALLDSPVARAGAFAQEGFAFVDPAALARGLRDACLRLGVRIHEHSPVTAIANDGDAVRVTTPLGRLRARRVALATNGFPSLLKRTALLTVPIYDYVLMTEPLSTAQLESIGWTGRHGVTDMSRQFHYSRKTADDRILWGGYDAVYHRGRRVLAEQDQRPATFLRLADHFFTAFPSLRGVRFSHAWGGMIDMSTRLVAFQGSAMGGKVAYSMGYTGLGVGSTRFGAAVMLDLLEGASTPRTRLSFPTRKPFPVPPEPFAYPIIQTMRRAVSRSDENGGKDGLLLSTMQRFGIGFDS